MEEKVIIENEIGLHARLASKFVSISNSFDSDIYVEKEGKNYNGKSLISIMSMGAANGESITISATGTDSRQALDKLKALLSNKDN